MQKEIMARNELVRVVNDLLGKKMSGEKFFDALDESIKNSELIIESLIEKVPEHIGLVISGGFGKVVSDLIERGSMPKRPYILYAGGIRSGGSPDVLSNKLSGCTDLIFVDDTIYGGKTYRVIKEHLKKSNIEVRSVLVVYDGCPEKRENIESLFRYYDHFESIPNYKF